MISIFVGTKFKIQTLNLEKVSEVEYSQELEHFCFYHLMWVNTWKPQMAQNMDVVSRLEL